MSPGKEAFGVSIPPLKPSWWSKLSGKDGKEEWLALGLRLGLCLQGMIFRWSPVTVSGTHNGLVNSFSPLSASTPCCHLIGQNKVSLF